MSHAYSEDLFEDTKMTFGQHLEELRKSLFKAVIALVIGFVIGLSVGNRVVAVLNMPIKDALEKYYQKKAVDKYNLRLKEMKERGEAVPDHLKNVEEAMLTQRLSFEEAFLDPREVVSELRRVYPKEYGQVTLPNLFDDGAPKREKLLRLFIWRSSTDDPRFRVTALSAQEVFIIWLKASFLFGFVLASPFVFYYIWEFVAAGLYPHEKRYVNLFLPISITLFLAGAALAFFVVFQFVLNFLFGFNAWLGIDPDPRISEWLSFALFLPIGFGISFQLPLVMLFLERIGIFTVEAYWEKWRIAVLVIAVLSMFLTPADPMSMMLMGVPLVVLYFSGIYFCKLMPRGRNPYQEAEG